MPVNLNTLANHTTYHFQLVADIGGTLYYGGDESFTTAAAASAPLA